MVIPTDLSPLSFLPPFSCLKGGLLSLLGLLFTVSTQQTLAQESELAPSDSTHSKTFQLPTWVPKNPWAANFIVTGLTFHPDGGENEGYPRQLDDEAYWVIMPGAQLDADFSFHRFGLMRFSTSLYRDCADVWSGFFHLGPRLNLPIGKKFVFRVGIGPTFLWRQNWYGVVEGYSKDSFYGDAKPGDFQTKLIWYGGDLDFEWKLHPKWSLVYANIPGWPEVITSNFGFRHYF